MAFSMGNNFNGGNGGYQNNGGEKKKENFQIGRIWGSDGQLLISVWVSPSGVKTIISGRQAVGKDPSTGANVMEQKMPNELPRIFLNADQLYAIMDAINTATDITHLNVVLDRGASGKLSIIGDGSATKITIESSKTTPRTITLENVSIGGKSLPVSIKVFVDYLKIAYKKTITQKLDADEFSKALASGEDE